MKLKTFFEQFDRFADAPNAVVKMRELVLDMAVKGKLTDRDLKKESVGSKYSNEPSSDVLPTNWRLLNFGKYCDIQGGNQPPKSQFSDEPRPGYVRMFQIRDLGERPVPVYISKESTNRFCREGEILIGRYGASVGKVFWAQDGAYNVALAKFIFPEDALLAAFAFWVLKSDFFQAEIAGASRSAQAGFNKGDLAKIDFPLPPLAEQERIVAKVDELMALCDRLEAQQQELETRHVALARASLARFADAPTPDNLRFLFRPSYAISPDDLRKSILTLAVQGKLVPQDPNDEPAEQLIARLMSRDSQASGRRKKSQPDLTFTADEIPFELPPGWAWERLGNIGETNIGLTYSPQDVSDVGIPVLRSSNVQHGKLDFDDLVRVTCEPKQSALVQDGDLLICARNGSRALVGKVAVIKGLTEPAAFGAFMAIFRSEVNQYLYHFIRSPLFRQMIEEVNTTTINQITQANLRSTLAPIPPFAEQRRIVAKVEQLMALVDGLETQLTASLATAANLLAAVVTELTTQA